MVLEGVVTNVAAFGAFIDIGVHQDGLVHVSAMSRTFVKDPRDVVKSGDVVRVKVLDVDIPRKRISLTLRLEDEAERGSGPAAQNKGGQGGGQRQNRGGGGGGGNKRGGGQPRREERPATGSMADALRKAGFGK
jgi:uncharacterized protein